MIWNVLALLPSGSPFGDPGPHGDLFQFLGPHFFSRSPFSLFQAEECAIILVICILKGEFSETNYSMKMAQTCVPNDATFCEDVFP